MKWLRFIVAAFAGLLGNFHLLNSDTITPLVQVVGDIRNIVKELRSGSSPELNWTFASISEEMASRFTVLLPEIIKEFKVVKLKDELSDHDVMSVFATYLSKQTKFVSDALLFKLCSVAVQRLSPEMGQELSQSEADTLTQCVFAKLKTNWSEKEA